MARVTRDDVFALLAVARLGAGAVSAEGKVVFWNRAAERITGLPAARVLGRRHNEIIVEVADDKALAFPTWEGLDARYTGWAPRPVTASLLCGSGGHRQVELTPIVVVDEPGGDALIVYMFEDPPEIQPYSDDGGVSGRPLEPQPVPVASASRPTSPSGPHGLTRREIEILRLVAAGTGTDQIASDLGISIHTVRNHVRSLRGKLEAKTKLDAVVTAMRHGLL